MISLDVHPFTLILWVVVVLTLKNILDSIGKPSLEAGCWQLYCKIAGKLGHTKLGDLEVQTQAAQRINKERKSISAQDQYARWTKLNREFDKKTKLIDELNRELANDKAKVGQILTKLITIVTSLPVWFFRVWYRKKVLFYLPIGLFPYPIERLLGLPFVVLGGVGLTVWMFSLNNVIKSIIFLITFPFETPVAKPIKQPKVEEVKDENFEEIK